MHGKAINERCGIDSNDISINLCEDKGGCVGIDRISSKFDSKLCESEETELRSCWFSKLLGVDSKVLKEIG